MASFDDIRRGLAANLAVLRDTGWAVSPYLRDNPTPPMIQVAGMSEVEYTDFGGGAERVFVIEAAVSLAVDVAAQMKLDELMDGGPNDLKAAVEADPELTMRMLDDGTIDISQEAACDDLECIFQSQGRFTPQNGVTVLLATWNVRVIT